jgi:hypothetical protein
MAFGRYTSSSSYAQRESPPEVVCDHTISIECILHAFRLTIVTRYNEAFMKGFDAEINH